jgi:hypothetical protein
MDPHLLHLRLNHLPVAGAIWVFCLCLVAWRWPSRGLVRTTLAFCVLLSLSTVAAYLTGEPAAEVVEHLSGIVQGAIERHEELAEGALWAGITLGAVAAAGLVFDMRRGAGRRMMALMSVLVAALGVLLALVADLGGHIHRPELG